MTNRLLTWIMRLGSPRFLITVALATAFGSVAMAPGTISSPGSEFYHVLPQDSWEKIAATFGTPVDLLLKANGAINPSRLSAGQRIFVPTTLKGINNAAPPFETVTESTTWQAALRGNSLLVAVRLLNGIGTVETTQVIFASLETQRQIVQLPPPPPTAVARLATPPAQGNPALGPPLKSSRMGVQGFFQLDPGIIDKWLSAASLAGFTWVKYQINWKEHESPQGQYPELQTLDAFFENAQRHHMNVLLSVAKAPDWARSTTELDGPPINYDDLDRFVGFLASHYRPKLDHMQIAIEIWNEPNTRREWNGAPISPQDYVTLLTGAYTAIKAQDPRFFVVTAGLAPTGINDGVTALDDRAYLQRILQAGAARAADAIGVHPYGWANPPALRCCNSTLGPPTYNDNPRFFFLNTLEDYRKIQTDAGSANLSLWATEFGWGTADAIGGAPADTPYFANTTSDQQAHYIVDAFRLAQNLDYMGPMFLWNLNMAAYFLSDPDQAAYSIMFGLRQPQQAYNLLRDTPKQ